MSGQDLLGSMQFVWNLTADHGGAMPIEAMREVRLVVDPASISLRANAPATGTIAVALGGIVFPLAGWNDFVLVILDAWASALLRMVRRTSDAERVHFMEGPYAVELARLNDGAIQLRAIERPNLRCAVAEATPLALVEDAVAAADVVLAFCRDQGHRSADLDRLACALAALRNVVPSLTSEPPGTQ